MFTNSPDGPIRWIVSDLDGTLLDSRQHIPGDLVRRIIRFTERGGHFTLATGRTLKSAEPFIRSLRIAAPVILYNGAKIYDPIKREFICEHVLPQAAAEQVIRLHGEYGQNCGLDLLLFHDEAIYSTSMSEAVRHQMLKDRVEIEPKCPEWLKGIAGSLTKMMFVGQEQGIAEFRRIVPVEVNTVQSEPHLLEVLPPGVHKGNALSALIRMVGAAPEQFIAVGDNLNDIEMVSMLPNGFAVGNAHPRLKQVAARQVTLRNDDSAMLEIINFAESTWVSTSSETMLNQTR